MKVKELIRILKDYPENAEVIVGEKGPMDGMVFCKLPDKFETGDLVVQETPIGPFIKLDKSRKGKFLVLNVELTEYYKPEDFQAK